MYCCGPDKNTTPCILNFLTMPSKASDDLFTSLSILTLLEKNISPLFRFSFPEKRKNSMEREVKMVIGNRFLRFPYRE
jgi:hypothetical protein